MCSVVVLFRLLLFLWALPDTNKDDDDSFKMANIILIGLHLQLHARHVAIDASALYWYCKNGHLFCVTVAFH